MGAVEERAQVPEKKDPGSRVNALGPQGWSLEVKPGAATSQLRP